MKIKRKFPSFLLYTLFGFGTQSLFSLEVKSMQEVYDPSYSIASKFFSRDTKTASREINESGVTLEVFLQDMESLANHTNHGYIMHHIQALQQKGAIECVINHEQGSIKLTLKDSDKLRTYLEEVSSSIERYFKESEGK